MCPLFHFRCRKVQPSFQASTESSVPEPAITVAEELLGFLALPVDSLSPLPSAGQVAEAHANFQAALDVSPTDPEAMNLAAITKFYGALLGGSHFSAVETSENLLSAVVSDTKNGPSLTNLKTFYELARNGNFSLAGKFGQSTSQLSPEHIQKQLSLINTLPK